MNVVRITPASGTAFLLEPPGFNATQTEMMKLLRSRLIADSQTNQSSGMIFSCVSSVADEQMPTLKLTDQKQQNPETEFLLEEAKMNLGTETKITHLKPALGFSRTFSTPPNPSTASQYFWTGKYTAYPGKRNQVLQYLSAFADDIVNLEPDTLNYLVLVPDDESDEDTLYLWEQYSDESGLREVHVKSKAAAGLKDTIGPLLKNRVMAGFQEI